MNVTQTIADRVEIEALRGEFTDAGLMRDYDRFASLFTRDGVWGIPHIPLEFVGRENIRAGVERGQNLWKFFVQTIHPASSSLKAILRTVAPTSPSSGSSTMAAAVEPCHLPRQVRTYNGGMEVLGTHRRGPILRPGPPYGFRAEREGPLNSISGII